MSLLKICLTSHGESLSANFFMSDFEDNIRDSVKSTFPKVEVFYIVILCSKLKLLYYESNLI